MVLRARAAGRVHRIRRGGVRGALGATRARLPHHVLHVGRSRGGPRRADAAASARGTRLARQTSKVGYPDRGCAPRPAARSSVVQTPVVYGRVVGAAALPGRAHSLSRRCSSRAAGAAVVEGTPHPGPGGRPGSRVRRDAAEARCATRKLSRPANIAGACAECNVESRRELPLPRPASADRAGPALDRAADVERELRDGRLDRPAGGAPIRAVHGPREPYERLCEPET